MTADDAVRGDPSDTLPSDELVTFHINGLPVAVQARAQEHADGLTRELTLIGAQLRKTGNTRELPSRLVDLIEQLSARYSMLTVEQEKQIAEAIAQDHDTIDLTYRLPAAAAAGVQALGDVLDEADDYCRAGGLLLTLATPDDLVIYRRWFVSQFTGQLAGQPPVSWDDYLRRLAT
jgi:hypothetical protein